MRAPSLGWWLAATLALGAPAAAEPTPVQRREALRAEWLGHRLPLSPPGLRKPDDRGIYDLIRQRIELPVPARGLPERARFTVQLVPQADFGDVLPLAAIDFEPTAVSVDGVPVPFERFPEGELLVELGAPAPVGQPLTLVIEAELRLACQDPTGCIDAGPLRHLLEVGWFPLSVEYPLTDRFAVELALETEGDLGVSGVGAERGIIEAPGRRIHQFETEQVTILPALALGEFAPAAAEGRVQTFAPFNAPFSGTLAQLGVEVLEFYGDLYQPYPFSRLAMTPISNDAGVAIGPQANIFLPEAFYYIAPDDELWATVRQTVAHEIGHQYFFNLVGILDAEEAWLSEAFAEYSATRFDEARVGTAAHRRTNAWTYLYSVPPELDEAVYGEAVRANPFYFEIIYLKGSSVLHTLRFRLGPELFDQAMRTYVAAFAGVLATTPEFRASLEMSLGTRLGPVFDQWLRQPGFPTLTVRAEPARRDNAPVRFVVAQRSPGQPFDGPLPVQVDRPGGEPYLDVAALEGGEFAFEVPDGQRLRVDPELTVVRRVRPEPAADVDLTGVVDGRDYLDALFWQGLAVPDPAFNDQLDVTDDGVVDAADLRAIRDAFGAGW
ncbi:MAG: hypothetical protein H6702_01050 [Myxococcales bacterium]|nr:hypothetical protein [Myxococcales bacterium]